MTTRLRDYAIFISIVLLGIALALVAQPPPATFAAGWSAPRQLFTLDLRDAHQALLAPDQNFHLVWSNVENGVSQIYTARMNLTGEWLVPPTRVSNAGVRSLSPQLALLPDNSDIIVYIEQSANGGLMLARLQEAPKRIIPSVGAMRQLFLSVAQNQTFWLAWSENREAQPYVYLTYFYGWGEPVFIEEVPKRLNPDLVLATQPALLTNASNVLYALYFADSNQFVDLRLQTFALLPGNLRIFLEPRGGAVALSHRPSIAGAYPIRLRADHQDNVYLFESPGGAARLTRFDASGARLDAQPITLERVRTSGAVDATLDKESLWLAWSADPRRGKAAQIYLRRFTLDGKPQGDEQRLTFTTSGAFQPSWFMDRNGIQHLFWAENISDSAAALFYANTAQPADVSIWQRLGFGGDEALGTMLVTIATGFMFVIPILVVNIWRFALVALALLIAHRLTRGRIAPMLAVFLAAELLLSAPVQEMIGQPSIALSSAAHWAFAAPALVLTLLLVRQWRAELTEPLRWPALAFIWSYVYYWMNAIVILREAYAV